MNNIDHKVTLKPILNIKPQLYIPILYSFIIFTLLFLTLLLPGLLSRGTYITITSSPENVEVYVDDVRVGSTPLKVFVTDGNRTLTFKKNNFNDYSIEKSINSRLFFTLFNKNIDKKHITLTSDNGLTILESSYKTMAEWSLINTSQINSRYQIPTLISSSITDYYYSSDFNKEVLDNYLMSSFKLVTNEIVLSDYIKGLILTTSDNRLPSISSIKKSALIVNKIVSNQKNAPLLLYNRILRNTSIQANNDFYQKLNDNHRKIINKNVTSFDEPENNIVLKDMTFVNIPKSNNLAIDVNFIHNIEEESFYILKNLITKDSYNDFLEENPIWNKINIKSLIDNGLVDRYYLDFSNDEEYITNISFYAAKAWCEWANDKYNIPEGWNLELPDENHWYSALQYEVIDDNEAWQWTDKGFYLYDHFLTDNKGTTMEAFTEIVPRVVVGKNKYNTKAETGRGVQNANWCTPFLSFRPVLVKE